MTAGPFAARLRADTIGTDAVESLPGGLTRLRSERFPNSYDLNAVWVPAGADQTAVEAAAAVADQRVWLPEPAPGVRAPSGWVASEERLMVRTGPPPDWPPAVLQVEAGTLHDARLAFWRAIEPEHAAELAARQVAVGGFPEVTSLAVLEDGVPASWCTVLAGCIEDVWTQPEHRRRGQARAVVRAAVAAGGRQLTVEPDNVGAVALYASEAFTDAGRLVGLLRG